MLHSRGLRFRVHRADLSGRPDLVFPAWPFPGSCPKRRSA
ncbi:MAG: hypothetical protein AB7K71_28735 [Polyangiaceae bacterium]